MDVNHTKKQSALHTMVIVMHYGCRSYREYSVHYVLWVEWSVMHTTNGMLGVRKHIIYSLV